MDLQHLRDFLAVARLGGFSRAAADPHVPRSQPALSVSIKALEEELGVRLLDRLGRRVRLTPDGEQFRERATRILDEVAELARLGDESRDEIRGPVRIGAGEGPVLYLLPEPIRRFRKRHPLVEIVVRNQPVEESLAMLRTGDLDFALRSLTKTPAGFDYTPVASLTFDRVVIAPRGHPIHRTRRVSLEKLAEYPFVMPWRRSTTRWLVESKLEEAGLPCHVALEAGGWEIIKRYVALGMGIAVVPAFCVETCDGIIGRPMRHLFGVETYGIVRRNTIQSSRAVLALIEALSG